MNNRIFVALPLLNEAENIHRIIKDILDQTYPGWSLYVCINQPDEWWNVPEKRNICINNSETFRIISSLNHPDIHITDKFSQGKGWNGKKHGVGWARKVIFDEILSVADDNDVIISLDGDTTFGKNYFESVSENFAKHPAAVALTVPYFHKPVHDPAAYRAILRYEIYMRHYSLNMWRIKSPYTFTALGSAVACRVKSCKAVGGMTPKMSGEDFYFLQKLRKHGQILFHNNEKVYPAARFSDRVYFGTGPAMIKGNSGDWDSYPVYQFRFFDEVLETYQQFPDYYEKTGDNKVTRFLSEIFRETDPFEPLRVNSSSCAGFVRSCHEKFDGLRVLQYLKMRNDQEPQSDEKSLAEFIERFYDERMMQELVPGGFSFTDSSLQILENIRMFLVEKEEEYQVNSIPG